MQLLEGRPAHLAAWVMLALDDNGPIVVMDDQVAALVPRPAREFDAAAVLTL